MNKARKKQFFLFFYCFIMTKYLRLTGQSYKKVRKTPNKNEKNNIFLAGIGKKNVTFTPKKHYFKIPFGIKEWEDDL